MKTVLVCAMIFGHFAAQGQELASARAHRVVCPAAAVVVQPAGKSVLANRYPAPVGEMTTENGRTVEGVFLRIATAPRPLEMINPLAPPHYGSAGDLVTYSNSDLNRNDNPNKRQFHADGIRLLTLRSFW